MMRSGHLPAAAPIECGANAKVVAAASLGQRGFSSLPPAPAIATRSAKSETLSARRQLQSDVRDAPTRATACTDPI